MDGADGAKFRVENAALELRTMSEYAGILIMPASHKGAMSVNAWMEPTTRRKHPGLLIPAIPGTVQLLPTARSPGTVRSPRTPGPAPA